MTDDNGILFACTLPIGSVLTGAAISAEIKNEGLAWVHMDARHEGTRGWLEREVQYLDHIILDALLADETRPRMVEFENGILLILRGINSDPQSDPEDMVSLRLWVDEHRIISLQRRDVLTVQEMVTRIRGGKSPKTAAEFLSVLCTRLFEKMEPVIGDLDENIDALEEKILAKPTKDFRQSVVDIRQTAILLRRYIAPQKEVLGQLRITEQTWMDETSLRRLQESYDRVARYIDDLDALRERAQVVQDELNHTVSDRLNNNLFILSIVSAVFLPLHFLTGLLGINVEGIPGADHPYAFWVFVGLLISVVTIQLLIFKKLKWF